MSSNQDPARTVRRAWGWMLAYGILLIVIGWIAAFNPIATSIAVGVMLGVALIFAGVASIFAGFRDFGWRSKLVDFVFGALALSGAFIIIAMPALSASSLVWAAGILFIVNGGFELYNGFKASEDRWFLILIGVIDLILGVYLAFLMPIGVQILVLAWCVGIGFILRGLIISFLAIRLRGMTKHAPAG